MIESDKLKVREAYMKAVSETSHADEVIEGMHTTDGKPMTHRMLIESTLDNGSLYDLMDVWVEAGKGTLDEFIAINVNLIKAPKP